MRSALLCGLVGVMLVLGGRTARAAAPVIEAVEIEAVRSGEAGVYSGAGASVTVHVQDSDGASDIASIVIVEPYGVVWAIPSDGFVEESPDRVSATVGVNYPAGAAPAPYQVTVTDHEGGQDHLSTPAPVTRTGVGAQIIAPGPYYSPIQDTTPEFRWSGTDPSAHNTMTVSLYQDASGYTYGWNGEQLWSYDAGPAMSVVYNADGTAVAAELAWHTVYMLDLVSRTETTVAGAAPRVTYYLTDHTWGHFATFELTAAVSSVTIARASHAGVGRPTAYSERVEALIYDGNGTEDFTSAVLATPQGDLHTLGPGIWGWFWLGDFGLHIRWETPAGTPDLRNPGPGSYVVTVNTTKGGTATITVPVGAVPTATMTYPSEASVITDTVPTLQWDTGPVLPTGLTLWEEARLDPVWTITEVAQAEAAFDFDGKAVEDALLPGHTYTWQLHAAGSENDAAADPRVTLTLDETARGHFTLYEPWPALPTLSGRLAYGVYLSEGFEGSAVQQYSPDPQVRHWLRFDGPEHPSWSPDGAKLAYEDSGAIWVDPLDGAPALQVVTQGAEDPSWSPDGTQIVYSEWASSFGGGGSGSGHRDLWVVNADGTNPHPLLEDAYDKRFCRWSPDGQWIAHRHQTSDADARLWAVHPDGTGAHEIAATGVQGYPDYQVDYAGESGWAPDATRLVVEFSASVPGDTTQPGIGGIGVLPAAGGVLRPIFLTPSGVACCAAPKLPTWSPDGAKIVFTSGHHLPVDPDWLNGKYEPGGELWMINADGSGEPTRLTYDYSFDGTTTWWAPDAFPDVPKGNWAYCAISACKLAGLVAGYPDGYHPLDTVTRDQMAVYIARGLAGGDAAVPTTTEAAFPDVPATYWAAKYIAYCKDHGIVQGYPDGYHPADPVDRGQMAVYVSRAVAGGDENVPAAATQSFTDVPASFWACRYVEYARSQGIVQGYPDGLYHPELIVTRDQMAMYVARAFRLPC